MYLVIFLSLRDRLFSSELEIKFNCALQLFSIVDKEKKQIDLNVESFLSDRKVITAFVYLNCKKNHIQNLFLLI